MPLHWILMSGFVLFVMVSVFVMKKFFPGVNYSSLKRCKLNADGIASLPILTISLNQSGEILAVHSIPTDFSQHISFTHTGRNWCEFIPDDFHIDFMDAVRQTVSSGVLHSFKYSIKVHPGYCWYQGDIAKSSEDTLLLTVSDISKMKINEEKLNMAYHSEDMTTFVLDQDSRTVTFDREDFISNWSGKSIPKVVGIDEVLKLVSQADAERLIEALEQVTAGVENVDVVKAKVLRDNDSEPKWISVRGYVISEEKSSGQPVFLGVIRDISESVCAEDRLKNLNLMLKEVLNTVPVGLYWKDKDLKYRGASRVFRRDTDLDSDESLHEDLWITEESQKIEQQVITTGEAVFNRQEIISTAGAISRTINISRVPLRSDLGGIVGLMVSYTDVTQNIQFRDQLIRRKEFLSELVDTLPVGFFAKDPLTGMTYRIWNREMEEIFGFSASEAVEQRDWNLFGTKAAAILKNDDDVLLADPDSGKIAKIYKLRGRHGQRTVSVVRVLLYDELLDSTLVAGVVDDITRETDLEDQLRQSQKMEAIGRLAGGVAHDFNNLLQVITGAAEIGISGIDGTEKSFKHILQAGEKAMFLTRQLLSFSRNDSFNRRVFLLDHRVGEFVTMVHRMIGVSAKLKFTPGAPDIRINGDPFQLEQVLMNLLVNARDAIVEGKEGLIDVETHTSAVVCHAGCDPVECAVISVRDTGEGISDDIIDKIFEPFFTTKAQGKGTGLGLASSYGIVAEHNGVILVSSALEEGSRFDVCIPIYSGNSEKGVQLEVMEDDNRPFRPLTLLLAEDEDMVREIAKTILEAAGHTVIEAVNGEEAVNLFLQKRDDIDLLVFDAIMPVMNGSEAFSRIHSLAPDLPVLFCTGYSRDTLVKAFTGVGQTDVLQKPYAAADLLALVKSLYLKK